MKRVLQIGHNDLKLFLRSKLGYIWLFVVPLLFTYFMGIAFRGPGAPSNPRPSVLVENLDAGFLGEMLLAELEAQGMNQVSPEKRSEAQRGIRIPVDFTDKVMKQERVDLEFFQLEGSSPQMASMVELRLVRAIIAINSHLFQVASQTTDETVLSEEALRAVMSQTNRVAIKSEFAGRRPVPSGFNQSLPGNLVMFLMMNLLIFGGTSVGGERASGVLRRMAVYPIHRWEIVLGKVYGRFLLGLVIIAVFLALGRFALKINIGENVWALLITLMIYSWVAASLGVWIGALLKTEDQIVGVCVLSSMLMAALGGCWWPLEIVNDSMKTVAYFFPTGWAMDALHRLISFGGGFSEIQLALGMLLGFALLANLGAAKTLRY